jgi:hypothetical protein
VGFIEVKQYMQSFNVSLQRRIASPGCLFNIEECMHIAHVIRDQIVREPRHSILTMEPLKNLRQHEVSLLPALSDTLRISERAEFCVLQPAGLEANRSNWSRLRF